MCHPLLVGAVHVDFTIGDDYVEVEAKVETVDRTGVEMEAMTACAIAALTVYDMCKTDGPHHVHRTADVMGEDRGKLRDVEARRLAVPAAGRRRAASGGSVSAWG